MIRKRSIITPPLKIVNWSASHELAVNPEAVPVYVISLRSCSERRRKLIERGMPVEFVEEYWPAFDSRSLGADDVSMLVDILAYDRLIGGLPRAGRIGNAISQRAAMEHGVKSGARLSVILEDDAGLVAPHVFESLEGLLRPLHAFADKGAAFICHLGVQRSQRPKAVNRIVRGAKGGRAGRWIVRDAGRAPRIWRSHAYVISSAAIRRTLIGEAPLRTGADDFIQHFELGYFDHFFFVEPGLFYQDESSASTIEMAPSVGQTDSPQRMNRLSLKDRSRRFSAEYIDFGSGLRIGPKVGPGEDGQSWR